jgi:hypothetical protein
MLRLLDTGKTRRVPVYRAPDLWRFIAFEELAMLLDPVRRMEMHRDDKRRAS